MSKGGTDPNITAQAFLGCHRVVSIPPGFQAGKQKAGAVPELRKSSVNQYVFLITLGLI